MFGGLLSPRMFTSAVFAIAFGVIPGTASISETFRLLKKELCWPSCECEPYLEPDESELAQEGELSALDRSDVCLAPAEPSHQSTTPANASTNQLPRAIIDVLLQRVTEHLAKAVSVASDDTQSVTLYQLLHLGTILASCIHGVNSSIERWGRAPPEWCCEGVVWDGLKTVLERIITTFDHVSKESLAQHPDNPSTLGALSVETRRSPWVLIFPPSTFEILEQLVSAVQSCAFMSSGGSLDTDAPFQPYLVKILRASCKAFSSADQVRAEYTSGNNSKISENSNLRSRIIDSDLDVDKDPGVQVGSSAGDPGNVTLTGMDCSSFLNAREKSGDLKCNLLQVISTIGKVMPDAACCSLVDLLSNEKIPKNQEEILSNLCKTIGVVSCEYLTVAVQKIQDYMLECQQSESRRYFVLTAVDALFGSILSSEGVETPGARGVRRNMTDEILSAQMSALIVDLLSKIVDMGLLFWKTRVKLVDAISQFIVLDPSAAQMLMEKFLVLLNDPEYRVRLCVSRKVSVLFATWDGHEELLQDVCGSFGVKVATITAEGRFSTGDIIQDGQELMMAETALLSLGEIAIASEKVENDVVFMICAHAALNPPARSLACAVLNRVGNRLQYINRWQYIEQVLGQLLSQWVLSNIDVSRLLEVREIIMDVSVEREFLQLCCPCLLPWLVYYGRGDQIRWLATALGLSTAMLVEQHFESIFAAIFPLYMSSDKPTHRRANVALQETLSQLADLSEDERDALIQKRMVQIVGSLLRLCSERENPQLPFFQKSAITASIKSVVDSFLDSDQVSQGENVIDKMEVFRPDRVFKLLLELHFDMSTASHPRHRRNLLTSLAVMLHVLGMRAVVPSTSRFLIHIILQSVEAIELQEQCCNLIVDLLDKLDASDLESSKRVLGEQLQSIVSKLVSCYLSAHDGDNCKSSRRKSRKNDVDQTEPASVIRLLNRLTVDGTLEEYIKDLDPFPDLPCFERMQTLLNTLNSKPTVAETLVQFVQKAASNPQKVHSFSIKKLRNQLHKRRDELYTFSDDQEWHNKNGWRCNAVIVNAVWKLVQLCDKHEDLDMNILAGQFLAAVGVGNPHAVVFHLPDPNDEKHSSLIPQTCGGDTDSGFVNDVSIDSTTGLSDRLVRCIINQLRAYLIDSNVRVIQLASQTLTGILSTDKGQRVFLTMNQQEKTYLEAYSRGVNWKLVKTMVDSLRKKSSELAIPLDAPSVWQTSGKSYDFWVRTLTHSLVQHTNDTILRLCQDVLYMKAPLAELVFRHVFGALAGENDPGSDLCFLISKQVENHIFNEKNQSTRSVRLCLNTLNCLRQCYIHSGMKRVSTICKRKEHPKMEKSGSSGGTGGKRTRQRRSSTGIGTTSRIDAVEEPQADESQSFWSKVYWLDIDYLSTARAAQQCAAYFSSVLYVEYWCEESFGSLTLGPPDSASDAELPLYLELLLKVYTRINEPDGVYGVIRSHKVSSQLLRYEHEGNWSKALENYDLLLGTTNPSQLKNFNAEAFVDPNKLSFPSTGKLLQNWELCKGLMRSLQQNGCSHILEMYRSGVSQQETGLGFDAEFKEMQYEAGWRAGCWDSVYVMENSGTNLKSPDPPIATKELCFHAHLHSSLKSLGEGDGEKFFSNVRMAIQEIVTHIAHTSMESTQNVNPLIVKLQMLDCVSSAWDMRWGVPNEFQEAIMPPGHLKSTVNGPLVPSKEQIMRFEATWEENLKQMEANYEMAEPYIAIHKVLLELLGLRDLMPDHLLRFGRLSRKAGRLNHAGKGIHELKCICPQTVGTTALNEENPLQAALSKYSVAGRVEEAKILWAEGHHEMAINLAKYALELESDGNASALLLCLTGKWLADTRSSSSRIILESYLKRAVELCKSGAVGDDDQRRIPTTCRTHFRLAHYADALYRNHQQRLMSSEWQAALRLRQHKTREYEALKSRLAILKADPTEDQTKIREYSMKVFELYKQLSIDSEEAQRLQDDKDLFLGIALENYTGCLCVGSKYDLRVVFRLISMWFSLSTNEVVMEAMLETLEKVQSYKFLPLVYQIASRLCSYKDSSRDLPGSHAFQKSLTFLLRRMANEHPYHSLYQLLALANGDRVKEKQRGKNVFVVDMDKKRAAEELLGNLPARDLLSQVKQMIEIYIRLAEMETTPKDANKKIPIPRDIRNIRELELVPVVTAPIRVDINCQYPQESFPHFRGFSEGIKVMIGINAPKYIECLGSDGKKYRQLAKSGNDDLRQDAVMEQLFGLVNNLLQDHPHTRKRDLKIRTYKVVPFTPSAGVLEWVDGTIPLGEYLLGSNRLGGAHLRYGGGDWSFLTCREHMCNVKDKRIAFETVLQNFHPVMHNFFLESFAQAEDWFEKRLAYTRSVATSSMVGYIVGLGDRHSMNVLLDQASAEVIHIDLGVAFEQGLMLKTPERIPFRLTRDVVDGMGVTGVEGIFRRCCEATLSVLRTNKESLLTIIEVFIHDPLYNWALSPLKALQRQQELEDMDESSSDTVNFIDAEGNKDAARALFRVKQKLDGYEEGEMRSLQGQVQQLIQDAQDPERLSQLFPGWGAWV